MLGLIVLIAPIAASAQSLGFGGNSGGTPQPINITASNGIAWNQNARTVTAMGNAQAVRGKVTITADQLIAHYQPKPGPKPAGGAAGTKPAAAPDALSSLDSGESQITRLDAVGHVHIFTRTDQAFGDLAVYHMALGELVLTGHDLKLITPNDTVTARDQLQYWSKARKAVAIGNALIVAKDHRSIAADRLTGYFVPGAAQTATQSSANATPDQSDKLRKVVAEGHVVVRTATDIATGDHGIYHPATGIAILTGNVHVTRGPNELAGQKARVNTKTGLATLLSAPGQRVEGLVLPNSAPPPKQGAAKPPQSGAKPAP
ncbi:LptA/OstA family protein [Acidiphilium sp. AL]|nr:LptA/OstA family protein [Acidiphilium sp. AL]